MQKKVALESGGADRITAQHEKGKLTARERIDLLLDEGTFTEIDRLTTHHYHEFDMQKKKFYGDGVVGELIDDCQVCNGSVFDVDGDGIDEDLLWPGHRQ